jgi:hypothetical protein
MWSPRSDSNRRPSDYESVPNLPAGPAQSHPGCSGAGPIPSDAVLWCLVSAPGLPERLPPSCVAPASLPRSDASTIRSRSEARSPAAQRQGVGRCLAPSERSGMIPRPVVAELLGRRPVRWDRGSEPVPAVVELPRAGMLRRLGPLEGAEAVIRLRRADYRGGAVAGIAGPVAKQSGQRTHGNQHPLHDRWPWPATYGRGGPSRRSAAGWGSPCGSCRHGQAEQGLKERLGVQRRREPISTSASLSPWLSHTCGVPAG